MLCAQLQQKRLGVTFIVLLLRKTTTENMKYGSLFRGASFDVNSAVLIAVYFSSLSKKFSSVAGRRNNDGTVSHRLRYVRTAIKV